MSLKVFNLQCVGGHLFEGWFGSHEDYDDQYARGLLTCPICQSAEVEKMPSAPRINSSRTQQDALDASSDSSATALSATSAASLDMARIQAAILTQMRQFVASTEDVGTLFAQEARAIHEGEAPARPIRGQATVQEQQALAEDGVSFVMLPDFLADDRLQ